jgi:hypothetical protein
VTRSVDAPTVAARREAKNRAALIEAYRRGLGLAAIVIVSEDTGFRIATAGEPESPAAAGRDAAVRRWWCRRTADAERIVASVSRSLRREARADAAASPPSNAHAPALENLSASVESAARRLGVALYSDEHVADDAGNIIARVKEQMESLKRAGELKSVNQSYRAYRLQASARGEKAAPYTDWLNQYKANVVRELAAALRYA